MSGIEALDYWDDDDLIAALYQDELEEAIKASFGGDRSAAGRYAANIRWRGHVPAGGGGGGDDKIKQLAGELSEGFRFFRTSMSNLYGERPLTPAEWASGDYDDYAVVWVKSNRADKMVVTKKILELEEKSRELGKAVYDKAVADAIAEGLFAQESYDEFIRYSREGSKERESALVEVKRFSQALLDNDKSVLPEKVQWAVTERQQIDQEFYDHVKERRELQRQEKELRRGVYFGEFDKREQARKDLADVVTKLDAVAAREVDLRNKMETAETYYKAVIDGWTEYQDAMRRAQGRPQKEIVMAHASIQQAIGTKVVAEMGKLVQMGGKLKYDFSQPDSAKVKPMIAGKLEEMTAREAVPRAIKFVEESVPKAIIDKLNAPSAYSMLFDRGGFTDSQGVRLDFRSQSGNPSMLTITTSQSGGGSYDPSWRTIKFDGDPTVLLHEAGHAMSYSIPEIRLMEQAHYQNRTYGKVEDSRPFADRLKTGQQKALQGSQKDHYFPGSYRQDKFVHPYMGRDYATERSDRTGLIATEVWTKALESYRGTESRFVSQSGRIDVDATHMVIGAMIGVAQSLEAQQ